MPYHPSIEDGVGLHDELEERVAALEYHVQILQGLDISVRNLQKQVTALQQWTNWGYKVYAWLWRSAKSFPWWASESVGHSQPSDSAMEQSSPIDLGNFDPSKFD